MIIIKKHKNERLVGKHTGFDVSHSNVTDYSLHFSHKYIRTSAKANRWKNTKNETDLIIRRKYIHCLNMGKAYVLQSLGR